MMSHTGVEQGTASMCCAACGCPSVVAVAFKTS